MEERPLAIVILSVLEVLGGAFLVILGVRFALSYFFDGSHPAEILGLIYLPLGIFGMFLSLAISKRFQWTWKAAMILAICAIAISAALMNFISVLLNGIVIYILSKAAVRSFLKRS